MMFGEVPIIVARPPSNEPNDSGISSWEGGVRLRLPICRAIGRKMASAPTFLMKADKKVTVDTMTGTCTLRFLRWRAIGRISLSTTPERLIAALTTRTEPTMMTMSSLKPLKARSSGTMPTITAANSDVTATRS